MRQMRHYPRVSGFVSLSRFQQAFKGYFCHFERKTGVSQEVVRYRNEMPTNANILRRST